MLSVSLPNVCHPIGRSRHRRSFHSLRLAPASQPVTSPSSQLVNSTLNLNKRHECGTPSVRPLCFPSNSAHSTAAAVSPNVVCLRHTTTALAAAAVAFFVASLGGPRVRRRRRPCLCQPTAMNLSPAVRPSTIFHYYSSARHGRRTIWSTFLVFSQHIILLRSPLTTSICPHYYSYFSI